MILFPNCKINLGLRVTGKRTDGFHNIETVFYPLPLKDVAEIILPEPDEKSPPFELFLSGEPIPGNPSDNLCRKAWELIKKDFPNIPALQVYLHKAIPMGAGLGGGSSNGAYTLQLLNRILGLSLSDEQLQSYALKLGSDCPFFIINKPSYATGRGEQMRPVEPELEDYYFAIADPGIHINTAWAFSQVNIEEGDHPSLSEIIKYPVAHWKDTLLNEFERPVFREYPQLGKMKERLYELGAIYASMTGTGSCLYGIFNRKIPSPELDLRQHARVHIIK